MKTISSDWKRVEMQSDRVQKEQSPIWMTYTTTQNMITSNDFAYFSVYIPANQHIFVAW